MTDTTTPGTRLRGYTDALVLAAAMRRAASTDIDEQVASTGTDTAPVTGTRTDSRLTIADRLKPARIRARSRLWTRAKRRPRRR